MCFFKKKTKKQIHYCLPSEWCLISLASLGSSVGRRKAKAFGGEATLGFTSGFATGCVALGLSVRPSQPQCLLSLQIAGRGNIYPLAFLLLFSRSVTPTLCDPVTAVRQAPVLLHLLEFAQIRAH